MNIETNKMSIKQLLSFKNEQFVVPSYQRRYAWGDHQFKTLYDDIDMLIDGDGHLFGTIILNCAVQSANLNQPEIVDGQQRLTTLVILIKSIHDFFIRNDQEDRSKEIRKIITCSGLDDVSKSKLQLGSLDNEDIHNLLMNSKPDKIDNKNIYNAYEEFSKLLDDKNLKEVEEFYRKLTEVAIIIRLDVHESKDAYKLFETINNRGLQLSATDIIKNFLLGHASKINDIVILPEVKNIWSNIIKCLDGIDTDDFLRQFMSSVLMMKINQSKLIDTFKKYYIANVEEANCLSEYKYYLNDEASEEGEVYQDEEDSSFEEINNDLNNQKQEKITILGFLELIESRAKTYRKLVMSEHEDPRIKRSISNLNKILSKTSYIFLMGFLDNESSDLNNKIEVLNYFETLMLRRHICNRKTSMNDDIFSKLSIHVCDSTPLDKIKKYINENELMPNDEEFIDNLPKHQFKGRLVNRAKYILEKIEYMLLGNTNEFSLSSLREVHLEHIIPQSISSNKAKAVLGDWEDYLGPNSQTKHKKFVNYIGNMTLLGSELNIKAKKDPFRAKKRFYKDSAITLNQYLIGKNSFKFKQVDERSRWIAEEAAKIWKV